ncbi:MAG: hypothetical protein AAB724_01605, partial [Patescibacteria group bacterium]
MRKYTELLVAKFLPHLRMKRNPAPRIAVHPETNYDPLVRGLPPFMDLSPTNLVFAGQNRNCSKILLLVTTIP